MGKASITIAINARWNGQALERAEKSLQKMAALAAASNASTSRDLARSGSEIAKSASSLYNLGKATEKVGQTLTDYVTVPLVAVGAYSGVMATQFDSALADVRKTSDLTEAQLASLARSALELSTTQPISAAQILSVEALGAQLGVSDEALEDFSMTVNGLDIATNLNAEQAATQLAQFANITNMAEGDYSRFGSTIVALGNNLATTESNISNMAMRLAAAGDIAGLSEAEILGMAGAMSSLGIKAEAGGSAMTTIISKISKAVSSGGDELNKFAEVAGMSAQEFKTAWETDAMGALESLLSGIKRLDEGGQDMNVTLGELGINEIRQSDAMRRLANNTDVLTDAVDLATGAWEKNSALTDEVAARNETMASRLQTLKNKVDNIAISIGSVLMESLLGAADSFSPLLEAGSQLASSFARADEGTQQLAVGLAAAAAAAGPFLQVVGKVEQALGAAGVQVGKAKQSFAVYKDALATTDGNQMKVYASADTMASKLGLARNATIKAAGSVENYTKQFSKMNTSAKQVAATQEKLNKVSAQLSGSWSDLSASGVENYNALRKQEKAYESTLQKQRDAFEESSKLVTQWSGSDKEARKAADGVRELNDILDKNASSMSSAGTAVQKTSGVMSTLRTGATMAADGLKALWASVGPMVAITAVGAGIAYFAEQAALAAAHADLMANATKNVGTIMDEARGSAESFGDGVTPLGEVLDDAAQSMQEFHRSVEDTYGEIEVQAKSLDEYVATIEELANQSDLGATDQARLKAAVEGFNSITGESIEVLDAQNGKISESVDKINELAGAWERAARMEAASNLLTEAQENKIKAQEAHNRLLDEYNHRVETYIDSQKKAGQAVDEHEAELYALDTTITDANGNQQRLGDALEESAKMLEAAGDDVKYLTDSYGLLSSELDTGLIDSITELPAAMQDIGAKAGEALQKGIEEGTISASVASDFISDVVGGKFGELPEAAQKVGNYAMVRLAEGVASGKVEVEEAAEFMNTSVERVIDQLPEEAQPAGMQFVSTLADAISDNAIEVEDATSLMSDGVVKALGNLPNTAYDEANSAIDAVVGAIKDGAVDTEEAASLLVDAADGQIKRLPEDLPKPVREAMVALAAEVSGAEPQIVEAAGKISTALEDSSSEFLDIMSSFGNFDLGDFSTKLAQAGVSIQDLSKVGTDHMSLLAQSVKGNMDQMVWAIENYDSIEIGDKEGVVRIEDGQLVDANNNVYTWNGTEFVDKDGRIFVDSAELETATGELQEYAVLGMPDKDGKISVDDVELVDANGEILKWDGTQFSNKDGSVTVDISELDLAELGIEEYEGKELRDKKGKVSVDDGDLEGTIHQIGLYEGAGMSDKSATVDVDDTGLVGATVSIGQYEGTVVSDKNGVVTIETTDLDTGTTKLLEYDGISLREKSSTAEVTGNAVDGTAVSSLGVTNDELQAMTGKSVPGEIVGNATDLYTSSLIATNKEALSTLEGKTVPGQIAGNAAEFPTAGYIAANNEALMLLTGKTVPGQITGNAASYPTAGYITAANNALMLLAGKTVPGQVSGNAALAGTAGTIWGTNTALLGLTSRYVTGQVNGNVPTYAAKTAADQTTASVLGLTSKTITGQVNGNVPSYAAKTATDQTNSSMDDMRSRSITAQVNGNVPGGGPASNVRNTNSAMSAMQSKTVTAQVNGNAMSVAGSIWDTVSAIGSLASRTVTATINTVRNIITRESAAGGFALHADGGIVPRYHAPGGIATRAVPLDIVGEAGAEAIVPLTNRKYAMPFVGMIAEETSKAMRHRDMRVTNNTNVYINGAEIKAKSPRALDAIQVLFDEFGITEGMGVV